MDSGTGYRRHRKKSFFKTENWRKIYRPGLFILSSVLIIYMSFALRVSIRIIAVGAVSIILAVIAKSSKSQFAFLASIVSLITMLLLHTWRWIDQYGLVILARNFYEDMSVFYNGLYECLMVLFIVLLYYYYLKTLHFRFSYDWFKKQAYLKLLKGFIFYMFFLILTWGLAFYINLHFTSRGERTINHTLFAVIISMMFIAYLVIREFRKGDHEKSNSYSHGSHSRKQSKKNV